MNVPIAKFQADILKRANGEFKVHELSESSSNSQGFPTDAITPVLAEFNKCIWNERPVKEKEVALLAKASSVFEITIPKKVENTDIFINSQNKIELRTQIGYDSSFFLEIDSIINEQNIAWLVTAIKE